MNRGWEPGARALVNAWLDLIIYYQTWNDQIRAVWNEAARSWNYWNQPTGSLMRWSGS